MFNHSLHSSDKLSPLFLENQPTVHTDIGCQNEFHRIGWMKCLKLINTSYDGISIHPNELIRQMCLVPTDQKSVNMHKKLWDISTSATKWGNETQVYAKKLKRQEDKKEWTWWGWREKIREKTSFFLHVLSGKKMKLFILITAASWHSHQNQPTELK
jgi:hypothetical protein